jgi:hypothetical protein
MTTVRRGSSCGVVGIIGIVGIMTMIVMALVAPRPVGSFILRPCGSRQQQQLLLGLQKQQVPPLPTSRLYSNNNNNIGGGLFGGGLFGRNLPPPTTTNSGTVTPVLAMAASRVKVGPLKFFLQIYLVAEQNKPHVKGSWVLNNNEEKGTLDMYYKDGTGMFSMELLQDMCIRIDRYGSRPSLQYMLQESVMIHGILDELQSIAFEVTDIEPEKRLIQFLDDDAIVKARGTLPARTQN